MAELTLPMTPATPGRRNPVPARAMLLLPGGVALLAGLDAALILLGLPAPLPRAAGDRPGSTPRRTTIPSPTPGSATTPASPPPSQATSPAPHRTRPARAWPLGGPGDDR